MTNVPENKDSLLTKAAPTAAPAKPIYNKIKTFSYKAASYKCGIVNKETNMFTNTVLQKHLCPN